MQSECSNKVRLRVVLKRLRVLSPWSETDESARPAPRCHPRPPRRASQTRHVHRPRQTNLARLPAMSSMHRWAVIAQPFPAWRQQALAAPIEPMNQAFDVSEICAPRPGSLVRMAARIGLTCRAWRATQPRIPWRVWRAPRRVPRAVLQDSCRWLAASHGATPRPYWRRTSGRLAPPNAP